MKQKAVIFDIDNTLLSQARRLLKAYNLMMDTDHTIHSVKVGDNSEYELPVHLIRDFDDEQIKEYYNDFLTTKYYDKEVSYNLDLVEGCKEFVDYLQKRDIKIIYMSARINSPEMNHEDITREMLHHFELPYSENTEIHLLESDHIPNNSKAFHTLADAFKSQRSKELLEKYDILAGIGDAKSDISAFNSAGIPSIQARTVIPESMYYDNCDLSFKVWSELYNFQMFKFDK